MITSAERQRAPDRAAPRRRASRSCARTPDGVSLSVVASAPLPLTGDVSHVDDLHLPMQRGDSLGFLFRTGEVALGVRNRPRPDGAVQSFTQPCDPCGMDGGTGTELLFDAVLEPDVDADDLGDETQDADGGGLGLDWEDDWFDDWDAGDQLDDEFDEDLDDAAARARSRAPRRRTCGCSSPTARGARTSLLISAPQAGGSARA